MKLFSCMLSEEQLDTLRRIAKSRTLTVSALVRIIINEFIEKNKVD